MDRRGGTLGGVAAGGFGRIAAGWCGRGSGGGRLIVFSGGFGGYNTVPAKLRRPGSRGD